MISHTFSGFRNVHDHDTYDADGTRMFRVRGTCAEDVRATQVPEVAASLNSEDVFILETPGNTWEVFISPVSHLNFRSVLPFATTVEHSEKCAISSQFTF